jgi:hypothetical protein
MIGWLPYCGLEMRQNMMVAGACGRSGWLVTSWQPGSRGSIRKGWNKVYLPGHTSNNPLPLTRSHLPQFYHSQQSIQILNLLMDLSTDDLITF